MGTRSRYKRITHLFEVGEVVQPDPDDPDALLYIQKLNDFEHDEARIEAQTARARATIALREGKDEVVALRDAVGRMEREQLIGGIVSGLYSKHLGRASSSIQADPDWRERLDIIARTDRNNVPEDQRAVVDALNGEYLDEISKRLATLDEDARADLEAQTDEQVQTAYVEAFIEARAQAVFMREMRYAEAYFGTRMCDAVLAANGEGLSNGDPEKWEHKACSHERLYESLDEARQMPDKLLQIVSRTFDRINVPASEAKGSARRGASSGPSRQPSAQEDSTVSTHEATGGVLAGTSASPSTTP